MATTSIEPVPSPLPMPTDDRTSQFSEAFGGRVQERRYRVLECLLDARRAIRSDLVAFTVDRNPCQHRRFRPRTDIPIDAPERIAEVRPHSAWNLTDEIAAQLPFVRELGATFVVAIPELRVFEGPA